MAPYVSVAISGGKTINHLAEAVKAQYKAMKTEEHKKALLAGDPQEAAKAIKRILERERNFRLENAAIYATDTALKSVGIAADAASFGAPSVSLIITAGSGAATALADLSLRIYQIARDVNEKHKANKILADTNVRLSSDIFETCPLLGCYYITCSNTSDVINFIFENMVNVGWQLDVQTMKRLHIDPMIGYAREIIANSRLEIQGLEESKGAVTDTSHGIKLYRKRAKEKMFEKMRGLRSLI